LCLRASLNPCARFGILKSQWIWTKLRGCVFQDEIRLICTRRLWAFRPNSRVFVANNKTINCAIRMGFVAWKSRIKSLFPGEIFSKKAFDSLEFMIKWAIDLTVSLLRRFEDSCARGTAPRTGASGPVPIVWKPP
jgi:hypothetical protein